MPIWQENITPGRFEGQTAIVTGAASAIAEAGELAVAVTFLLSRDGSNINGVVLASDNGWNAI